MCPDCTATRAGRGEVGVPPTGLVCIVGRALPVAGGGGGLGCLTLSPELFLLKVGGLGVLVFLGFTTVLWKPGGGETGGVTVLWGVEFIGWELVGEVVSMGL